MDKGASPAMHVGPDELALRSDAPEGIAGDAVASRLTSGEGERRVFVPGPERSDEAERPRSLGKRFARPERGGNAATGRRRFDVAGGPLLRRAGRWALPMPLALLAGCGSGISFLDPHGPVAAAQRDLFFEVTGWMMVVVLPAIVLVPLVAWRYRRRATRSAYAPEWHFSWPLEILVWGVPVILVCILAGLIVGKARSLDPYAAIASDRTPLEVEVIGLKDKWLFVYPGRNVASVGVLALPVGRPVRFRLTSDTVMQSFIIPSLGSQIYAMAGMVTELNLLADRPAVLMGQNTQFNGFGFQAQKFEALAMPQADFDRWMAAAQAGDRPLDESAYAIVSQTGRWADLRSRFDFDPSKGLIFSSVDPGLFSGVVARYRPDAVHRHGSDEAPAHPNGEHAHADR